MAMVTERRSNTGLVAAFTVACRPTARHVFPVWRSGRDSAAVGLRILLTSSRPAAGGRRRTPTASSAPPEFLSRCDQCRQRLSGRDIYMYKGEKAFCSAECRQEHMVQEEHHGRDKCGGVAVVGAASTSPDASAAGGGGHIFFMGVAVA